MSDVNINDLTPDWRQERLNLSTSTSTIGSEYNNSTIIARSSTTASIPTTEAEVKPTLYEELKLGQEGAGFKRLVS